MKRVTNQPTPFRQDGDANGSAIVAILSVLALLSLLLISMLQSLRTERSSSAASVAEEQARLSAESGANAAAWLLLTATSNRPAYLIGKSHLTEGSDKAEPALLLGATNLTSESQMIPLVSFDLKLMKGFPKLPSNQLEEILENRLSSNVALAVDLNDRSLADDHSPGSTERGGLIAETGRYPALWQRVTDTQNHVVGRYAFILTDESARLNPALHLGHPRDNPTDWERGPADLPITNPTSTLLSAEEAKALEKVAGIMPTEESFETAFDDPHDYAAKKNILTRDPCLTPDLIPAGMPEGGQPKYNLNDLATNPVWGSTPYARATNIAAIIDRNLPKFKQRDPSLVGRNYDPTLYLRRLCCSIVDYIASDAAPTGPPGGEPFGRDLVPYVTQIGERCTRKSLSDHSVTVESTFFAEIWNPTTSTIPAGGIPRLRIGNRARMIFGTAICLPFRDYDKTAAPLPELGPGEFTVIAFDPEEQTWESPGAATNPPKWDSGPTGNRENAHQSFEFYWNSSLVDLTRRPQLASGNDAGGLLHQAQQLKDATPCWQYMSIPTYSGKKGGADEPDMADEAVQQGSYRFTGDPRCTFLSAYKWQAATDYASSLWKGIRPSGLKKGGFVMDPLWTWRSRDRIPVDLNSGASPLSANQTPDQIPSPYNAETGRIAAPFVLRKGPMLSLGELGNIYDPAQTDDLGQAPDAGLPKTVFCCGGGRTLRIGQPEFHMNDPKLDWDVPGKRAVELLDLFTLNRPVRPPGTNMVSTNAGVSGRINVNTAPHNVLTALFTGVCVTSDKRFTNCMISAQSAEKLATLVEEKRPFEKLSDLRVITPELVNAEAYTPPLSKNVPGSSPPVADVFDRAREEAFGKIAGHCVMQSRTFRLVVLGEALNASGKTSGRSVMESLVRLTPDAGGRLIPTFHDIRWHSL